MLAPCYTMVSALELAAMAYEVKRDAGRAMAALPGQLEAVRQAAERAERERCIAICRKYPDNLMAVHIAREIGAA